MPRPAEAPPLHCSPGASERLLCRCHRHGDSPKTVHLSRCPYQSPFRRLFSVTCWPRLPRQCRRRRRARDRAPGLCDAIAAAARILPIVTVIDIIVTFVEVKMIMTFVKMTVIICHRRHYHRQDIPRRRDGHPCRPPWAPPPLPSLPSSQSPWSPCDCISRSRPPPPSNVGGLACAHHSTLDGGGFFFPIW